METPICDFVRTYADREPLRFHMPGHKGFGPIERLDITEITGADVLYSAGGIIQKSRENAARLFGTKASFYSTEGSTLCIRAMLFLLCRYAGELGRRPLLAACRNAHRSFVTGCALLDIPVRWIYGGAGENLLSCCPSPRELEAQLDRLEERPLALYVTSPDYLGQTADLPAIRAICRKRGMLLLVDNAHGAYLRFLPESRHPMDLGADLCCDSAHKTLPVLTGGAYLHISHTAPPCFARSAEDALGLFASTSPSYLILESLDRANALLEEDFPRRLAAFLPTVEQSKERLQAAGFEVLSREPMKLCLKTKALGWEGSALAARLEGKGIYSEFSDPDHLVFMLSPLQGEAAMERLTEALLSVERRSPIDRLPPPLPRPRQVMGLKEALFAPRESLAAEACRGRILAEPNVTCPPAVPVLVCGEEIDEAALACFRYYGMEHLQVLRDSHTT